MDYTQGSPKPANTHTTHTLKIKTKRLGGTPEQSWKRNTVAVE